MFFSLVIIKDDSIEEYDIDSVTIETEDGTMQILANHLPIIAKVTNIIVGREKEIKANGIFSFKDNKASLLIL